MKLGRKLRSIPAGLVLSVIYASAELVLAQNGVGVDAPSNPSACAQLTKLREDIAAQEKNMKISVYSATVRHQELQSTCILWENYAREEEYMLEYAEKNAAVCGLSDDLIQQIRHHYNRSLRARDGICSLQPLPRENPCVWTVTRSGTECKVSS